MSEGGRQGPPQASGPERGAEIIGGLEAAMRALDAGQLDAAAQAMAAVEAACAIAASAGETLNNDDLARARDLHARVLQLASASGDALSASLQQSARVRSATDAYKSS